MHKNFKRFGLEGVVGDDSDFARLRAQYETLIIRSMREEGYVPILGLGPMWSTTFNGKHKNYDFVLSIHGTFVGKRRAWEIEGMDTSGHMHPRNTPKSKSEPSSTPVESE